MLREYGAEGRLILAIDFTIFREIDFLLNFADQFLSYPHCGEYILGFEAFSI